VFLLKGDDLSVLHQEPYEKEALLQRMIERSPELIAGPTTLGDEPARLLLVRREMGVPSAAGGAVTFSLDHLFLDGDGVPVLVEVKRSTDHRIRREVVGQMLDYVANAVAYWPVAVLRQALEATAQSGPEGRRSADDLVAELTGDSEVDVEGFWRRVEDNLRVGRVRLLFVADVLPPELVRVIEFLNEQMSPAEVLGVELRQFAGGRDGVKVLVPSVVGRTSAAVTAKVRESGGRRWTRDSLLEDAALRCGAAELALMTVLLDDAEQHGVKLSWGAGVTGGVCGWYQVGGTPTGVWILQAGSGQPGPGQPGTPARWELHLGRIVKRLESASLPLDRIDRATAGLRRIPATVAKLDAACEVGWVKKFPQFPLSDLAATGGAVDIVLRAVHDLVDPHG